MSKKSREKAVAAWAVAIAALGTAGIRPALAADDQACDEKFAFANGLLNGNPAANTPPAPAQAIHNDLNEDYTSIIQSCPTFSHLDLVYNNLAIAYLKLNQTSKAVSTLETALVKFPQSSKKTDWQYTLIDSDMKLADSLLQAHPEQARPTYQKAIQLMQAVLGQTTDPTTRANLTFAMGNAQFNIGDYSAASQSYTSLMGMNPPAKTAALALYNRGYANLNLAAGPNSADKGPYFQQAASSFQDLITRFPTDPNAQDARLQMGKVYYQQKNYSQAATAFRQLLESPAVPQAERTEALADLGYSYANSNQYGAAIPVFRQYIQANPGTVDADKANVEIGYLLRFKTQPPDLAGALASYQAAVNSKDAGTALAAQSGETAVATSYVDNKDYARALPIYEALRNSTAPSVREDAMYGRAVVLLAMKDNRTEQAFSDFIQSYPNSKGTANAAFQLGVLQYADKNYTAAAADFSRAARSAPAADATPAQQKDSFDLRTDALYWA
ncbi:MAG: tetratricopeptide repeat protein, partial [Chloroflexi bacterium]|nr:tetratricopeptide repeat protein [Chloroflexota bacterium]